VTIDIYNLWNDSLGHDYEFKLDMVHLDDHRSFSDEYYFQGGVYGVFTITQALK